jgi:hypothetical protein
MFFDKYYKHKDSKINPSLLWEYDLINFDYITMRELVVQRVVERGWPEDWFAILNLYGVDGTIEAIKNIPYLNDKDMQFVSTVFQIPLYQLRCYEKRRSRHLHWNS